MSQDRPPLELQAELKYPDGTTTRWDRDAQARDLPTGVSFKTKRYEGFADAQLALSRRIDLDYPDLGLMDGVTLIGHDGSVAYDGTLTAAPRSLQTTPAIMPQAQGWMAHARDQSFVEVYVDRDLSKWTAPGTAQSAAQMAINRSYGSVSQLVDETGSPTVELGVQGPWVAPFKPISEAWWLPQPGVNLAWLWYSFVGGNASSMLSTDTNWKVIAFLASNDRATEADVTATLWPGPGSGYLTTTGARTAAGLQVLYEATPAGSAGAPYYARFKQLAVYGAHGLSFKGGEPGGFYASQMIANIAARWAPKLDTSGVKETTFPIPHASFLTETVPYDAFQTLNAYHRWEMAVYESRRLQYYPIDLGDYDWEIRTSDPGVTVDLQGPQATELANGVNVRYVSLDTGYETRLTPATHSALRDSSPDNPANRNGRPAYPTLTLSVPTHETGALQIGRAYLAEFNEPKAPGSITIQGHVRDRAGHWQPAWKVRAGDRLVIADLPDERVRIVGETDYQHDSKTNSLAIDSQFKRLDSILARLGVAVEASGVSLPAAP